jgi:hypothetical protein
MEHTLVSPASGNEYVGHVPVGQLTGTGTFRCAKNGAVYTGEYEGNRFHGIGEYTWANGDVYRGQFNDGKSEGDGVFTWANGDVYRGQFKDDTSEGDGVLTFANGDVYRGQWKGGVPEGGSVHTLGGGIVRGILSMLTGRRTFEKWEGGKEVSSVPFDAANPAHAAVLRAANEAEARRVGAHRRRTRSAHSMCGAGSGERRRSTGGSCGGALCAAATCNSSGGVRTRQ